MKMATIPTNGDRDVLKKEDPYPYGWRDVQRTSSCGEVKSVREPLTLEDMLHPQVGDFRMHSEEHERYCTYLYNVLTAHLANDPNAVVLHDVRVAWAHPDIEAHGPDISVIFNVRERRNWRTFDEVEEGTKPSLIIEITSPNTRSTDVGNKVTEYELTGVPLYVIVDIIERKNTTVRQLLGYQLTPDGYIPLDPNEQGWLWLESVRLWLGFREENIACYDEAGNLIEDYVHVTLARKEAEAHAAEAEIRAVEAETRAAEEAQARVEVEEHVRQLEAELHRLRGEGND